MLQLPQQPSSTQKIYEDLLLFQSKTFTPGTSPMLFGFAGCSMAPSTRPQGNAREPQRSQRVFEYSLFASTNWLYPSGLATFHSWLTHWQTPCMESDFLLLVRLCTSHVPLGLWGVPCACWVVVQFHGFRWVSSRILQDGQQRKHSLPCDSQHCGPRPGVTTIFQKAPTNTPKKSRFCSDFRGRWRYMPLWVMMAGPENCSLDSTLLSRLRHQLREVWERFRWQKGKMGKTRAEGPKNGYHMLPSKLLAEKAAGQLWEEGLGLFFGQAVAIWFLDVFRCFEASKLWIVGVLIRWWS